MQSETSEQEDDMLWINFGVWDCGAGHWFSFKRIFLKGHKWTPFIIVRLRREFV